MFDRPEEKRPRNTGTVNNRTENTIPVESKNKYLYAIIGVLAVILLIGGGIVVFNLGKNSDSKPYSNSENQTLSSETSVTPSKIQEIPFQELIGKYKGNINNKEIKIDITLEGKQTRYKYSENKNRSFRLTHFGKTNQINLFQPKEGLAEFTAFKEGNTIILRSGSIELRKIN